MSQYHPNELVEDLPEAAYHADAVDDAPTLSSSIAHLLVSKTPRHAHHAHPKLGKGERKATKAMHVGAVMHRLLLGAGPELQLIEGFADYKKKDAQVARELAKLDGKLPILEHELADAEEAAAAVRDQLAARGIDLRVGMQEATVVWTDRATGVRCRGRLDHLEQDQGGAVIHDLKKAETAHPRSFERAVYSYGADIQAHAYREAIETIRPELAGRVRFEWIVIEAEPPYVTVVRHPLGSLRASGENRWRRACEIWARCLKTNVWPGYPDDGVEAVPWAERDLFSAGA